MGNMLWDNVFGESTFQFGASVRETRNGDYIITGRTNEGRDAWLIETDANGKEIWEKSFNDSFGSSVRQTRDGGYIITGTKSFKSAWLLKTNSCGDTIWDNSLDASNAFEFNNGESVEKTNEGGYLIAGTRTIQNQNVDDNSSVSSEAFHKDAWMIKTDEDGNILWSDMFIRQGNSKGRWAQQTQDGGCIFVGSIESNGTNEMDLWLIKTDAQGKIVWEKIFGRQGDDEGVCLQQTIDGGYIILGNTRSFDSRDQDIWLIKTDSQGNELWNRVFGESGDDSASEVHQTADGGYIIIGTDHNSDFYVIKTDANGSI